MGTTIRHLGQMQIEQQELDEAGRRAQEEINALALQEYELTGSLSSKRLCEAVAEYERTIEAHVLPGK